LFIIFIFTGHYVTDATNDENSINSLINSFSDEQLPLTQTVANPHFNNQPANLESLNRLPNFPLITQHNISSFLSEYQKENPFKFVYFTNNCFNFNFLCFIFYSLLFFFKY
jgi:hypothetical protein